MEDMSAMATVQFDERKYSKLLSRALPMVIQTDAEYSRIMETINALMRKPEEEQSEEEMRLLELLAILVEEYEERVDPVPKSTPGRMLAYLLEETGTKPADIAHFAAEKPYF